VDAGRRSGVGVEKLMASSWRFPCVVIGFGIPFLKGLGWCFGSSQKR
jgi:hypothetical protein